MTESVFPARSLFPHRHPFRIAFVLTNLPCEKFVAICLHLVRYGVRHSRHRRGFCPPKAGERSGESPWFHGSFASIRFLTEARKGVVPGGALSHRNSIAARSEGGEGGNCPALSARLTSFLRDAPNLRALARRRDEPLGFDSRPGGGSLRSAAQSDGGEGGNRTRDRAFAEPGLTTWRPRHRIDAPAEIGRTEVKARSPGLSTD